MLGPKSESSANPSDIASDSFPSESVPTWMPQEVSKWLVNGL